IKRNGLLVSLGTLAADFALAGMKSLIPADEVIDAMGQVGRALPETLRETGLGGLAASPTGRELARKLLD
ncbi:MAG: L-serine ammonia-lyase, iron-sulfur-dependent, subunit alpha, partial [Synergistaceae bacterium]|nr:L-serine ammonia-lyase, iron-sulfur-dependent, subunit alpha [Synergistaceae bacterium]